MNNTFSSDLGELPTHLRGHGRIHWGCGRISPLAGLEGKARGLASAANSHSRSCEGWWRRGEGVYMRSVCFPRGIDSQISIRGTDEHTFWRKMAILRSILLILFFSLILNSRSSIWTYSIIVLPTAMHVSWYDMKNSCRRHHKYRRKSLPFTVL